MKRLPLAGVLLVVALPLTASAQTTLDVTDPVADAGQQPPVNQGPMKIERIHSGPLFAPEVKATRFAGDIKPLIGGSGGWVADEAFFFGGGGYWMPETGHSDRELAYGGFIFKWFVVNDGRFSASVGALLGGGSATVPQTVTEYVYPTPPQPRPGNPPTPVTPRAVTSIVHVHQDFVVAEPEANVRIALSKTVRLAVGVGYRFAGNDWYHYYGYDGYDHINDRISGATVTFGVHIGM